MVSPDIDAILAANTTEMDELRAALARAQRAARRKQLATDELVAAVHAAAKDAMLAHGPAPKITAPARDRRSTKPEVALLHLTDWQVCKRTRSYDMAIAADRVSQSVQRTVELADIQRSHHPVRECHVMLGGDMVEGTSIFPGQAWEVEAAGFEQLVATAGIIDSSVRFLLEHFETVTVWEEIGNHGRIGRKGDVPHGDNVDRMAFTLARSQVGADKRLTWHPWAGGLGTHVHIGAYIALLAHGDEIKSFGGNTPAFAILRKANAWATGVVEPFRDLYLGHFHHAMTLSMANGGRVFVTGSPESDNEYAREFVAATSQPSQRLHFVDPARGRVTAEYLLWLT